jgi:hypothetical protein
MEHLDTIYKRHLDVIKRLEFKIRDLQFDLDTALMHEDNINAVRYQAYLDATYYQLAIMELETSFIALKVHTPV